MDDNTSMTFTSFALIMLLLIMLVMFACHHLGPRLHNRWLRTNKEEKIGLSKNKLFHANGYMIHSGSEFLLSNSGSFKRFDTIDKEDYKQAELKGNTTTPLWNLPQPDNIPPQPLRPAPAPKPPGSAGSQTKSVTFSFSQLNEIQTEQRSITSLVEDSNLSSCIRNSARATDFIPPPIVAPPPPRLTAAPVLSTSSTAIPRPIAKRQQAMLRRELPVNGHGLNDVDKPERKTLTRRNSSTNPFLCESTESFNEKEKPDIVSSSVSASEPVKPIDNNQHTASNGHANHSNPFIEETNAQKNIHTNGIEVKHLNGNSIMHEADTKQQQSKLFRNRSFSEAEAIDIDFKSLTNKLTNASLLKINNATNPFTGLSQRVKGPHMLQKTISEDYLFRKLGMTQMNGKTNTTTNANGHSNSTTNGGSTGNGTWSFGRSLMRQDSILSLGRRNSSQVSLDTAGELDGANLERAISCDSVASDSSLYFGDLDQNNYTQITGNLCVGLQYDKNSMTYEGMELTVSVLEAKGLICPFSVNSLDTFVRIYLVPDQAGAMQTKVFTGSANPSYNESFVFWLKRQKGRHSLWFHLYHNGAAHTLIGEAEMEINEIPNPITTWIPLTDSRKCNAQYGELMFSLSYLPTAERLTIVVVKARNLKLEHKTEKDLDPQEVQNIFVKVYLMNNDKKILKKRTSIKRKDRCPIFNESMIFSVPPQSLTTTQLRLTVFGVLDQQHVVPMGHIIAGSCATGKGLRHWHQMLSSLRKPVAMWHVLRRASNQPIFTGGAEAVVAAMQSNVLRAKRNSVI